MLCPYVLPRITFSILPRIPSTVQRSMCELFFGKSKWDENGPFITSHKDIAVSIQHRPLANVARSCRTTRLFPFLASVRLPLTPLFDHPRRAEHERPHTAEYAHQPLRNTLLRPAPTSGRNRISLSVATRDCNRDTVLGGTCATGVPHPVMGDGCALGTVESRCAARRCWTPTGTASPDAVPQMPACRSHSPG